MSKTKTIQTSGSRKSSRARLTLTPGKGLVRINGVMLDAYEPKLARLRVQEPMIVAGDIVNKVQMDILVQGGGVTSQVDAIRQSIGKALSEFGGEKVRKVLLDYDRAFLVADTRRKEVCKPNDSKARAKRQSSKR